MGVKQYYIEDWRECQDELHDDVLDAGGSIRCGGVYQAETRQSQERVEGVFKRLQLQVQPTEYEDPILSNPFLLALHIKRVSK